MTIEQKRRAVMNEIYNLIQTVTDEINTAQQKQIAVHRRNIQLLRLFSRDHDEAAEIRAERTITNLTRQIEALSA